MALETWELLSYVVTVVGLPFAIGVFLFERAYPLVYAAIGGPALGGQSNLTFDVSKFPPTPLKPQETS